MSELSAASAGLTADLIVAGRPPQGPVLSPDGHRVAWTTSGPGEQQADGWLAPAGGSAAPARLADDSGLVRLLRWSPDSASLCYVAGQEVRRLRVSGGEPAGAAEPLLHWGGEIAGLFPLAGGQQIAVVAGDELTEDDQRRQAAGDDARVWSERAEREHWRWHRLRLLDLASGQLTVAAGLAGRHVVDVTQRPGGGPLAVLSWDCPEDEPGAFTSRLHIADLSAGTALDLGPAGLEARSPAWWAAPGGWQVAWLAAVPPASAAAVITVAVPAEPDTAATASAPADLTAAMNVCPDELVQVADGPPVALFADGLDTALYRLDPAAASFERVTRWDGRASSLSVSRGAAVIAVLASTAYAPPDVHAGPPDALSRISDTRPELRSVTWGTQERLSWPAPDGLEIGGVLILPPGRSRADGPFPLVTIVHGGPYSRWADELMTSWWSWGQWLAADGFAVFHPNPRGSQGRGRAFAGLVAGAVGRGEWTDIMAGVDHLVAAGVADPARLGIAGWSHGGFMAAWAATQTSRFRAALMAAGIADWGLQVGLGELGRAEAVFGGSFGWEGPGPHRHDELSPLSYAGGVTAPVLILHGENDTNVPVGQALYFHRALTHFGTEHELVIYPREGHSFTGRAHQADVLERTRSWFRRWLGSPAAAEGGDSG